MKIQYAGEVNKISSLYSWRRITPDDGHYFFGYDDRNPWNSAGTLHLALRFDQSERLPERGECAEIGFVDRRGNWTPQSSTRAWRYQQGVMQLFLPRRPECFVYNDFDSETGRLVARIFSPKHSVIGPYDVPIYAISPDSRWAASLDFCRIPSGYSYADAELSSDLHPRDLDGEGLRLLYLDSGEVKLIVSCRTMLERHSCGYELDRRHIWLNHAIFNCNGSRLLWLFRQTADAKQVSSVGWQTFMYTSDLSGRDAKYRRFLPKIRSLPEKLNSSHKF